MVINKIFVAAPSNKVNGGGESLHQFADACNRLGYDTYMYYFDNNKASTSNELNRYKVKTSISVEDRSNNLFICPEMYTFLLKKYTYIQKCIWFLSLDFYLCSLPIYRTRKVLKKWNIPYILFPLVFLAVLTKLEVSFSSFNFKKDKIEYFLYNVEYAREFIENNVRNSPTIKYLCGPLNEIYFEDNSNMMESKENIVLYNPKKASKYTRKLIEQFSKVDPSIIFFPIQNMTQQEVKNKLMKAKVYIDFGYFPGPERIPREAAMMKCNIITSNLGSAANNNDVPINPLYKFALTEENINKIILLILDMIHNYYEYVKEFDPYREKVRAQKQNFQKDVAEFLKIVETH